MRGIGEYLRSGVLLVTRIGLEYTVNTESTSMDNSLGNTFSVKCDHLVPEQKVRKQLRPAGSSGLQSIFVIQRQERMSTNGRMDRNTHPPPAAGSLHWYWHGQGHSHQPLGYQPAQFQVWHLEKADQSSR